MNDDRHFIFVNDLVVEVSSEVYSARYGLTGLFTKDYTWGDMICISNTGNNGLIWICQFFIVESSLGMYRYFNYFDASTEEDNAPGAYILADKYYSNVH